MVDAGGKGLNCIIQGFYDAVVGKKPLTMNWRHIWLLSQQDRPNLLSLHSILKILNLVTALNSL